MRASRAEAAAVAVGTRIRMSMLGLEASLGIEVLPMCSMVV